MFFNGYDDQRTRGMIGGNRFSVVYRLFGDEHTARGKATDICAEQTVEFPVRLLPPGAIPDYLVGQVENFEYESEGQYLATISFADEIASGEFTQFLNVIFGNISIKHGIQVARIFPSESVFSYLSRPRFGVEGIRDLIGVTDRPLLFTALKPMGLSARDMADLAFQFVEGGIDIIKDDHGLTNQPFATFDERVGRCSEAVREANARFGKKSIYVANITAPAGELATRALKAKELGAGGIMVSPGIVGLDALRAITALEPGIPVFAHPAFIGSYVLGRDGISCGALFGSIMRMSGADVTIFPNYGGRFPLSKEDCLDIARACREEFGGFREIFPSPAGGMELANIADMTRSYGKDYLILVGGGLFNLGPDLVVNCREFLLETERSRNMS